MRSTRTCLGAAMLTVACLAVAPGAAATPPTPEGARTITVTPATDLVDGQIVAVSGNGFDDNHLVGILQCGRGLGIDGCDPDSADLVLGISGGAFDRTYRVAALLDTPAGAIDCRTFVPGCRLSVNETYSFAGATQQNIAFDPVGPLEPSPTVAIQPSTDLLDEQMVTVTGTGLRPGEYASLLECPAGATELDEGCRGDDDAVADANGQFSVRYFVEAQLGTTDCRVAACELVLVAGDDRIGRVPLDFDPAGPLRADLSLAVTPHTGLFDRQAITVDAGGYTPNGPVEVVACQFTVDFDRDECDLDNALTLTASADGSIETTFTVAQILATAIGPIDCTQSFCVLAVADQSVPPVPRHGLMMETLEFGADDDPAGEPPVDPNDPSAPAVPTSAQPAFTG